VIDPAVVAELLEPEDDALVKLGVFEDHDVNRRVVAALKYLGVTGS